MSEQYSEDAKHIEKLYEFNDRLSESTDKSQNVKDYEGIIELSKTSTKTKQLGAQLIPRYFKFFTGLATEAFDAYMDIIEEVDVGVRVQAIRGLPLFCKDTPEFIPKIIDVLVQCLNTEELVERNAVHKAFMSLFRQDTKASLTALFKHTEATLTIDEQIREKVLHFIRDKVFPLKGELLKPQEEMERHINRFNQKACDTSGQKNSLDKARFELMSEVKKKLQRYSLERILQDGQLSRESLKNLFYKFDKDGDGKMIISELNEFTLEFGKLGKVKCDMNVLAKTVLKELDKDNDGMVKEDEFATGITKWLKERKAGLVTCAAAAAAPSLKVEEQKKSVGYTIIATSKVITGIIIVVFLAKPFMMNSTVIYISWNPFFLYMSLSQ